MCCDSSYNSVRRREWLVNFSRGVADVLISLISVLNIIASLACIAMLVLVRYQPSVLQQLIEEQLLIVLELFLGPSVRTSTVIRSVLVIFMIINVLFSCIGPVAVLRKSTRLLVVNLVYLVLILASAVIACGLSFEKTTVSLLVKSYTLDDYSDSFLNTSSVNLMDKIMLRYDCCGVLGYADFSEASVWMQSREAYRRLLNLTADNVQIPTACCKLANSNSSSVAGSSFTLKVVDYNCYVSPDLKNSNANQSCAAAFDDEYGLLISCTLVGVSCELLLLFLLCVYQFFHYRQWNKYYATDESILDDIAMKPTFSNYSEH